MRAITCHEFAPVDRLRVENVDPPPCGPGRVRVDVAAGGLNYVDALIVEGRYQIRPPLPFVPGSEIAGVVSEVGADAGATASADSWTPAVGDRVMANIGLGGFAEQVVVGGAQLTLVPDDVSLTVAATVAQSYSTAWFALRNRARAEPGQKLLVLGAGGGVGLATCDVGAMLGLDVIAAASTEEKRLAAMAAGARATIDSSTMDVKARARELGGGSVDLVVDPVGGQLAVDCLRALGYDGQLVVIGFASGSIPSLPANQVLLRNRRVTGVDWGLWAMEHPDEQSAILREVLDAVAASNLHPVEPHTVAFDRAPQAMNDLLERRVTGKVALVP